MDNISPERRSENMRRIISKGMKPEVEVRRLVHKMGYRFRIHRKDLPGRPDIVFPSRKKVIFVHGCFWHQLLHPLPVCKDARMPKSNTDYWVSKLERNRLRDIENKSKLEKQGWDVLFIWQCDIEAKDKNFLIDKIKLFLCD